MRVDTRNRERLRSGLLGPLGQEVTDMLMEEIDQAGLRNHVDERFDEQRRHMDERFREIDRRFVEVHAAITGIGRDTRLMVFSVSGALAVVAITTMVEAMLS